MNILGPLGGTWDVSTITVICLLLFIGAVGKSAQFPLHVWLPDAMEGPTPISALIHAATMVTAGVFMVARLAPLYNASPAAMSVVAIVGAITMVLGATIALTQTDIKRVVAYSTMSQLGYMMMACGLGAYAAGMYHLLTHGAFKALLFLGCGSVIIALHHEQDMRRMGGLKDQTADHLLDLRRRLARVGRLSADRGIFQQGRHSRLRLGGRTARTGLDACSDF